jgi:PKD repeat protein
VEDVHAGWNALLTYAVLDPMSIQPAGDPDSDGNGIGIGMYEDYGHSIYESGLAMMALASAGTPDREARTGPVPYVRGRTYSDIAQDMADWFAWGQNDEDLDGDNDWARGGWRYQPNSGDSDNSNTQFPVLGLAAAEDNWDIIVPGFVKDELDHWLFNTQNAEGGFGYSGPWDMVNVGKTGAGIMDLVWAGVSVADPRVVSATNYIETHWGDPMDEDNWGGNVGDFYAMYAVKKGSQMAGILNYGTNNLWDYDYSSYLVDVQAPDGRFDEDRSLGQWFGSWQPMATSWALLILSEGLYEALPVAIISPYQYGTTDPFWYEGTVQFDGTLSRHTDPDHDLVGFDWTFGDDGTASDDPTPFHTYCDNGQYLVTLTVTDDQEKTDTDTRLFAVENVSPTIHNITAHPPDPVALSDQPVQVSAEFSDPGSCDTHDALWDWGDGTTTGYTVTSPIEASHQYTEPGVYEIQLTVTDDDRGSDTALYQYVVVYDPEEGFVTGGGWIWSEPGWCQLDELCGGAEGRANFGFVSKYKKGAKVPTGNTEFNYSAGGLNFHSDAYDWLVINQGGTNAQYKGSGTINGELGPGGEPYRFMVWAKDLDPEGMDTFRIRIWYEGDGGEVVVYDNGFDQPINGGNITIHTK